jgi:hypothetical protein
MVVDLAFGISPRQTPTIKNQDHGPLSTAGKENDGIASLEQAHRVGSWRFRSPVAPRRGLSGLLEHMRGCGWGFDHLQVKSTLVKEELSNQLYPFRLFCCNLI